MPQLPNEFGSVEHDSQPSHDSRQDSSPPSLDLYLLDLGPMYTPISLYTASLVDTWKFTVPAGARRLQRIDYNYEQLILMDQ